MNHEAEKDLSKSYTGSGIYTKKNLKIVARNYNGEHLPIDSNLKIVKGGTANFTTNLVFN